MKSIATIIIHGLALVGAHELYKEWKLQSDLNRALGLLQPRQPKMDLSTLKTS